MFSRACFSPGSAAARAPHPTIRTPHLVENHHISPFPAKRLSGAVQGLFGPVPNLTPNGPRLWSRGAVGQVRLGVPRGGHCGSSGNATGALWEPVALLLLPDRRFLRPQQLTQSPVAQISPPLQPPACERPPRSSATARLAPPTTETFSSRSRPSLAGRARGYDHSSSALPR